MTWKFIKINDNLPKIVEIFLVHDHKEAFFYTKNYSCMLCREKAPNYMILQAKLLDEEPKYILDNYILYSIPRVRNRVYDIKTDHFIKHKHMTNELVELFASYGIK